MQKKLRNYFLCFVVFAFLLMFVWMCLSYDKHIRLLNEYEYKLSNCERAIQKYRQEEFENEFNGMSHEEIVDRLCDSIKGKILITEPD